MNHSLKNKTCLCSPTANQIAREACHKFLIFRSSWLWITGFSYKNRLPPSSKMYIFVGSDKTKCHSNNYEICTTVLLHIALHCGGRAVNYISKTAFWMFRSIWHLVPQKRNYIHTISMNNIFHHHPKNMWEATTNDVYICNHRDKVWWFLLGDKTWIHKLLWIVVCQASQKTLKPNKSFPGFPCAR